MASSNENVSMALFCDFENVALGVRDANLEKFDIKPVLERLLLKGSIVVKKAYCDWDRYKAFKAPMHEANFELIEIPHVRQSGKNSADIRMVVDALDLCYTKSHVDTFVIISGDSDFSPLVSKLRENAKKVIGVGVKQSTSDLLVANCDEFIFYDDLVRESRRAAAKRDPRENQQPKRTPEEEKRRREEMDKRRTQAVELAVETFDALVSERGDSGKIWASVLKEAIKRRKPDFSESYSGFRTFGNLLEEARARGFLEFGRDEKSGAYVYRSSGAAGMAGEGGMAPAAGEQGASMPAAEQNEGRPEGSGRRGRSRGGRNRGGSSYREAEQPVSQEAASDLQLAHDENAYAESEAEHAADDAVYATHPEDAGLEISGDERDEGTRYTASVYGAETSQTVAAAVATPVATTGADTGKRKPPKVPARQAKAAKQKAAQAAVGKDGTAVQGGMAETAQAAVQDVAHAADHGAAVSEAVAEAVAVQAADAPAAKPVGKSASNSGDKRADKPDAKPADKGRSRTPAKGRGGKPAAGRKPAAEAAATAVANVPAAAPVQAAAPAPAPASAPATAAADSNTTESGKPARKPASRGPRRPRKPAAKPE